MFDILFKTLELEANCQYCQDYKLITDVPSWNENSFLMFWFILSCFLMANPKGLAWCEPNAIAGTPFHLAYVYFLLWQIKELTCSSYHVQFRKLPYLSVSCIMCTWNFLIKDILETLVYPKLKSNPWKCWSHLKGKSQQVLLNVTQVLSLGHILLSITFQPICRALPDISQQHVQLCITYRLCWWCRFRSGDQIMHW